MVEIASQSEGRLCPACDYDLRGNTSGRCPECGIHVGHGVLPKVPWVHRQHRGGRRAYFETLRILLFRPAALSREVVRRVSLAHARQFHRESVILGTILGSGTLVVALLIRGPGLDRWVSPDYRIMLRDGGTWIPRSPAYVLTDSLLMLLALVPAVYLSLHATMATYRWFFGMGASETAELRRMRRRAKVLAYYGSGLVPPLTLLIGGAMVCATARADMATLTWKIWSILVPAGLIVLPILAMWVFYYPTLVMMRRAGRAGMARMMMMAYAFPAMQVGIWTVVLTVVFWVVGYLAIVLRSVAQ
jgi:hypothetical protein